MKARLLAALAFAAAPQVHADPQLREEAARLFGRLEAPAAAAVASPEAKLGRALFWDTRISLDGKTAWTGPSTTLVTPAAFDRFLGGDDRALDAKQQAGLRAFISTGCAGCHSGPLFGAAG